MNHGGMESTEKMNPQNTQIFSGRNILFFSVISVSPW